ncbi:unnamed protein product [Phytomonas sp. Hart1]|nr:unnamed protein product [Phytomonas sp. Hart1]|eukprot:CCW70910.1 unnamed protein product [Phytomonas sp. isolate Hart1]
MIGCLQFKCCPSSLLNYCKSISVQYISHRGITVIYRNMEVTYPTKHNRG